MTTTLKAASWRARLIFNRWHIRLYADMTCGDCIGTKGPFPTHEEAVAAGEATGLPDGDKTQ